MAQYIDKAVLVAEIEKRMSLYKSESYDDWQVRLQAEHDIEVMQNILSFLDTLEVKEVDLEKETKNWWKERLHLNPENQLWMDAHQSIVFAKYFFEPGIKAQKGE